ncbi:5-oxoprolinase subunit PxpA [Psychroserpens sp. XS_ASV72]|uniref:5-oxoprolinase subunit PxpA n=1 Tax=Psychroserpens sp. XS_ASV72 TaxID=3241293 RepID=UPI003513AF90
MNRKRIDINCDLGEGLGNEAQLMRYLSSCNVACGGHAGDLKTMKTVVDLAKRYGVKVGAHPSFPDKSNFGRVEIDMSPSELSASLMSQIESLRKVLFDFNLNMHHVKPHGALYNKAVNDVETAEIIVDVIKSFDSRLVLYAPYRSVISDVALNNNVQVFFEGFADRNYNEDLSLVSRQDSDAIISDSESIFKHVFEMVQMGFVRTKNGVEKPIKVDTICMHGDHKNAVENLMYLRRELEVKNI